MAIVVDVNPSSGGEVSVNGDVASSYPETFSLKSNSYDVLIEAIPAPGYCFVGWDGENTLPGNDNPLELRRARDLDLIAVFAPEGEVTKYASADGSLQVAIPYGIYAQDEDGGQVTKVDFTIKDDPPQVANSEIVGYAYQVEPDGATFSPSLSMAWSYDPADIPADIAPEQLALAYYEPKHDAWVALESQIDSKENTISAWIDHFSLFAILAPKEGAPPELAFSLGQLNIRTGDSKSGEPVTSIAVSPNREVYIDVPVRNIWDTAGSYTVTLEIDGAVEEHQQVTLAPGHFTNVTFETSRSQPGTYSVAINGLTDEATFTVIGTPPPASNVKVVAPLLVGVFLAVFIPLMKKRKRDRLTDF